MKKKKRSNIYLQYKCKDGSRTVAATASIGLMYWLGRIMPQTPIENPKPFEIYVTQSPTPSPYSPMFMPLVVAGLERTFGTSPPIPEHLHDPAHGFVKDMGFHDVEKHLKKGTPQVVEYEQVCLDILHWLKEQGEITVLAINEPMLPFDL